MTTNTTKKELIQRLLDDKKVTMDEAFMLLDEPQPYSSPSVPLAPYYLQMEPDYWYWDDYMMDWKPYTTYVTGTLTTTSSIVGNGTTM